LRCTSAGVRSSAVAIVFCLANGKRLKVSHRSPSSTACTSATNNRGVAAYPSFPPPCLHLRRLLTFMGT